MSHRIECLLILAFILQVDSLHLGEHARLKRGDGILVESYDIKCQSDTEGESVPQESLDIRTRVQGSNEFAELKQLTRAQREPIYRDEVAENDAAEETADETEKTGGEDDSNDSANKPEDGTDNSDGDENASEAPDDNETEKEENVEKPETEKEKEKAEKAEELEGEGEEDKDGTMENTTANQNEQDATTDEDKAEPVEKELDSDGNNEDNDSKVGEGNDTQVGSDVNPALEVQIELELVLSPQDIVNLISGVSDIIYNAGDYLLSLILTNLKHNLHHTGMNERFNGELQRLMKTKNVDSDKALNLLTTKIREQFGRPYEIQLVKFLKDLRNSTKF